jgi:hypothetical protein
MPDPREIHIVQKREVPKTHDAARKPATPQDAAEALKWFRKLWAAGSFDCEPQDYEFMVQQCLVERCLMFGP